MPWSESVSGAMGGVRQVNLALVMLCVLLALPTIALQENEDQLNKDEGVVDKLIPGTTEGNYSWVEWGSVAMCPLGSFAFAFRLKTEPVMLLGDFTGTQRHHAILPGEEHGEAEALCHLQNRQMGIMGRYLHVCGGLPEGRKDEGGAAVGGAER
ncbi:hypothetical protein O3P69_010390 [Scylla paramamosain]|uniref:Uncharacterized protein n=1 Tax=Scylla paramamosain TaxID=85552 RepID=A0AAW0TWS5_SCYPA